MRCHKQWTIVSQNWCRCAPGQILICRSPDRCRGRRLCCSCCCNACRWTRNEDENCLFFVLFACVHTPPHSFVAASNAQALRACDASPRRHVAQHEAIRPRGLRRSALCFLHVLFLFMIALFCNAVPTGARVFQARTDLHRRLQPVLGVEDPRQYSSST